MPEIRVRAMQPADLAAAFAVQCSAYPAAYHESAEIFANRLELGPGFCFVAEEADNIVAYVFAHPWLGVAPPLHSSLSPCPEADHVFLHDLCVTRGLQGASCGSLLYQTVESACRKAGQVCVRLVALAPARGFWLRQGFSISASLQPGASYGKAACMERSLEGEALPA